MGASRLAAGLKAHALATYPSAKGALDTGTVPQDSGVEP